MTYLVFLLLLCLVLGVLGVAANPSPLFGAVALVFSALGGCGVLVGLGGSFVGIILFLIYLGGMLVVFAYSVALAADPHPETWADYSVFVYVLGYLVLMVFLGWEFMEVIVEISIDGGGLFSLRGDFSGVVLLFSVGGYLLLLSGWGLLLALFVVLELTRGRVYGGLRMP
uniref:NADH-ubiquinone oxidoreductase chain 6 n=1 Tax=Gekko subpalmatus TaxID=515999 RepID=A0A7G9UAQ3_9SAUR|nr:NADH dehydrogenase subunit 6 [Gekko subpalmatus]QNN90184.1 NADH dehydrogenase subunit 6 [Gekko subpalmatus]